MAAAGTFPVVRGRPRVGLVAAFAIQMRVIGALIIREMHTRFGRENIGFLWIVGEPVIFCVGVTVMWSLIHAGREHGISIVAFVITGYNPLTLWRHCVGRSVKAFEANGSLMFHRQVTTTDVMAARVVLEICGSTVGFAFTAGAAVLLGFMDPPQDWALLYAGWFYVCLFSAGTSLVIAGLSEMSDVLERFVSLFTYASIPLSGAFTMVDWVPQKAQPVLLCSPSVNAFEMIRGGWFGPTSHAKYDMVYTSWCCGLLLLAGLYLTRHARRLLVIA